MFRIQFATALVALTLGATTASAEYIDFSSSTFAAADGLSSYSYTSGEGTQLQLSTTGTNSRLSWEAGDGLGVKSWWDYDTDEVGGSESLKLTFANPTYLNQVFVTDLFRESGYLEIGYYSLDGGSTVQFLASADQTTGTSNGLKTLDIGAAVTSIKFTAPGQIFLGLQNHEYSVGGISLGEAVAASAVPELDPAPLSSAVALVVAAGLVLHSRRRQPGIA